MYCRLAKYFIKLQLRNTGLLDKFMSLTWTQLSRLQYLGWSPKYSQSCHQRAARNRFLTWIPKQLSDGSWGKTTFSMVQRRYGSTIQRNKKIQKFHFSPQCVYGHALVHVFSSLSCTFLNYLKSGPSGRMLRGSRPKLGYISFKNTSLQPTTEGGNRKREKESISPSL